MEIDLLYYDGCPSWQEGLENLKNALLVEEMEPEIKMIKVENNHQALSLRFLGSPSFRLNGEDLWSEIRTSYNLSCRVYVNEDGFRRVPTVEMLRMKLRYQNPIKD